MTNRAAVGLVVAATLAGCAPRGRSPVSRAGGGTGAIRFREVAREAGIDFQAGILDRSPLNIVELTGGGAGFLDADQDGWQDVVLTGYHGCALYRNESGRRFRNVTAGSGLDRLEGAWQGLAAGDYDGDGRVDLLLTGHGRAALMRSLGACRFADATRPAGLRLNRWSTSAAFADVNGDGWLDLYVCCYVEFRRGMPEFFETPEGRMTLGPDAYAAQKGSLFLNAGGRFVEATGPAGLLDTHGKALGVAFADYDQDGDSDFYLANDRVPGDFFRNMGTRKGNPVAPPGIAGGTPAPPLPRFANVALENGTALSAAGNRQAGMGVSWGDYDGDERLDLVVTTFSQEPKGLYRQLPPGGAGVGSAGPAFLEVGTPAGIAQPTLPWVAFGVGFADWDNDGWLDLMIANGHVQDQADRVGLELGYRQPTQVLRNRGDGVFEDVSRGAGEAFSRRIVGRAVAVADYDRDGRLDALVSNLTGPPLLLHNESAAGSWAALELAGGAPNRLGIGARVRLLAGGRSQVREVRADGSYMAASQPLAHFGLGGTVGTLEAEIRWPDGREQRVYDLQVDRLTRIPRR